MSFSEAALEVMFVSQFLCRAAFGGLDRFWRTASISKFQIEDEVCNSTWRRPF
jgi:hypothetical protein